MNLMRSIGFVVPALSLLLGAACSEFSHVDSDSQSQRSFGQPTLAGKLTAVKEVDECSGLARSLLREGSYYVHNDSGDPPRFWRIDLGGNVAGPFELEGAQAFDWEDCSSAEVGGKPYLFFADIGDNLAVRKSVTVHRVEESKDLPDKITRFESFVLEYPDGARDAEAFLVDPRSGDWWVVSKSSKSPSRAYRVRSANQTPGTTIKMEFVAELKSLTALGQPLLLTGGDFSPDGDWVSLRGYFSAHEFPVPESRDWTAGSPQRIAIAIEAQGEAIAYSLDGKWLITASEGVPCAVSKVEISPNRK
ncbi:MAG: hypothetical protein BroJett009_18520 [Armatimonadota bacterium]|nr:MAG: hypothetical protein BroJett009_18520 [Armatimonadota bacterium]